MIEPGKNTTPNNTKIQTVLTVKNAVERIKSDCPETAISEHFLRNLIKDGVLSELKAGNNHLVMSKS